MHIGELNKRLEKWKLDPDSEHDLRGTMKADLNAFKKNGLIRTMSDLRLSVFNSVLREREDLVLLDTVQWSFFPLTMEVSEMAPSPSETSASWARAWIDLQLHSVEGRQQTHALRATHCFTITRRPAHAMASAPSPSSSPRLPSPPPIAEDQLSPLPATEEQQKLFSSLDNGASRRIRPGTGADDMTEGPPLVELSEVCCVAGV
jgi:hypothetical protein